MQHLHLVAEVKAMEVKKIQDGCVLAADIGGTNLRLALATLDGQILARWKGSTRGLKDAREAVEKMREGALAMLAEGGGTLADLRAVAAGVPGITDAAHGVVIAAAYLPGWSGVAVGGILEEIFGVPAALDNDVNVAALGEGRMGAAVGQPDFVMIAAGTGIGSGIVLRNQVHQGSGWLAGEIGYMLLPGSTVRPIDCHTPGPLEEMAGGEGIRAEWKRTWSEGCSVLGAEAEATEIFDAAQAGDKKAAETLERVAKLYAYSIYNMALVLNCPLFLLSGSVGVHPALVAGVQKELAAINPQIQPKVVASALGTEAQLLGAVALAIETAKKKKN